VFGRGKYRETYGEKYVEAISATGLAYQTLANAAIVSRRYAEFSLRKENLGWHHHRVATAIEDDALLQRLLEFVEHGGWSVAKTRKVVKVLRAGESLEAASAQADPGETDEDEYSEMLSDGSDPDALDRGKRFALVNGILADLKRRALPEDPAAFRLAAALDGRLDDFSLVDHQPGVVATARQAGGGHAGWKAGRPRDTR
jgi:hypothetical protein